MQAAGSPPADLVGGMEVSLHPQDLMTSLLTIEQATEALGDIDSTCAQQ